MIKYNINQFYMKYGLYPAIWFTALFSANLAIGQVTLTFTADQPSCFGYTNGNITVHPVGGTDPYTYLWGNGQSGQTNMGLSAGNYPVTVTDHNGMVATGVGTISQPAALSLNITPSGFGCEPNGLLSAVATGGTGVYAYSWSNGSNASAINVNTGGLYYVTVSDANGCQAIDNEYVTPSIYLDVQVTNIPCATLPNGGAVLAAVAGGQNPYTFHWNTGASTQMLENLPQGAYTVTVTDTRNCTSVATGIVQQPDPISVAVTVNSPACGGNNGSATLQASGGTAPYRYIWVTLGNVMGATQNNLAPGSYYVCTYDANNCQKDINVVIPVSSGLDVNIVATKALCPGQNTGTATAIVTPPGNYHYAWNIQPNSNFAMINGIGANTLVIVTVTDPITGCMGIDSAVIGTHEQVKVTVTDVDVLCLGDTLGSATAQAYQGTMPYHYIWYSNQDSIGAGPVITGLSVGAYGVIVTDDHGCTAAGVADITAQSGPKAEFEIKQLECIGDSVEVQLIDHSTDALGTLSQWDWQITPDNGAPVIHLTGQHPANILLPDSQTGTIQLTVTSSVGCTAQKTLIYKVSGVRNFQITLGASTFTCNNLPVPITVTGDTSYTYVWSPLPGLDLTNAPFYVIANPSVSTTYTLNVSNGLCDTVILFDIKRAEPINVVASPDSTVTCMSVINLTATANAAANATFAWFNSDSVQIGAGSVLNTLTAGDHIFTVIATDSNGCTDSDAVTVTGNAVDVQIQMSKPGDPCNPGPVQIIVTGSPAYTYTWTPDPTLDLTNAPFNVVANPLTTTTYTLYVNNGVCDSTFQIIVERAAPINLSVESNNVVTCLPIDTLRAFANAGVTVTYQWFENGVVIGAGATLQVATNGVHTYTVVATDANGCTDSEQVSVSVQSVAIQVELSQTGDLCHPGPVQITVTGDPAFTYNWTPDPTLDLSGAPFNVIANPTVTTTYTLQVSNGVCDSTYHITVERANPINLSVESNDIASCQALDTLHAMVNTTLSVTLEWFENGIKVGDGPSLEVVTNGTHTYTVIATASNGCTESEQVTVTGRSLNISLNTTLPNTDCEQTPIPVCVINLNPGDNLTYDWQAPAGLTVDPSNTACVYVTGPQGDYVVTVTVTNQYGCSDTLQALLHFLPTTSLDGKILVDLCNGLKVKFFNNSGISGTWSFGDNTQDTVKNPVHLYGAPGPYHVFFTPDPTNFPCIQRFDTIINVIEFPALQADFTDTLVSCDIVGVVEFTDKTIFYNPIASWDWTFTNGDSSSVQNPVITFVNEGMYDATLIVTDINGCMDTATHPIKVQVVDASLADTLTICPGDSVALNLQFIPNYVFEWHSDPADPDFDPTIKNPFVSPADTTIYTATVINGVCVVDYQVVVNPISPVDVDLMAVDTILCNENPITILINNPNVTNIEWYNNPVLTTVIGSGTSYTVDPVKSQVIYVKAYTIIGECPALDSIKIDDQTIKLGVAPYDQQICVGSSATLLVNVTTNHPGALSYAWTPNLPSTGNPVVSPSTNTTYTVTVTNQALCTTTAEYHVNVLDTISVKAEIVGPDTLFPGETAVLLATATGGNGTISYEWFPQTWLSNPYVAQTESTPSDSITYWVIAQSDGRCPDTAWVHLEYRSDDCKEPYIFVPKAFTPNGDNFNDFFIVRGANITELEFIVWDRWGEIVYRTTDLNAQGWDGSQNGKELTPDAYAWYCRVKCGSGAEYITKGDVTLLK
jgi:gliding motility-associated-like protein